VRIFEPRLAANSKQKITTESISKVLGGVPNNDWLSGFLFGKAQADSQRQQDRRFSPLPGYNLYQNKECEKPESRLISH